MIGCGDGERDANEECDDGNYIDGDGCSSTCTRCVVVEMTLDIYCREAGYVCSGSNSTSIRPDTCELGTYAVQLTFDQLSMTSLKVRILIISV